MRESRGDRARLRGGTRAPSASPPEHPAPTTPRPPRLVFQHESRRVCLQTKKPFFQTFNPATVSSRLTHPPFPNPNAGVPQRSDPERTVHQDHPHPPQHQQHLGHLRVRKHPRGALIGANRHQSRRELLLPAARVAVRQQRQAHRARQARRAERCPPIRHARDGHGHPPSGVRAQSRHSQKDAGHRPGPRHRPQHRRSRRGA